MAGAVFTEARQTKIGQKLARLRGDVCVVERPTTTKDGSGADVQTFADVASVSCSVVAAQREVNERIVGGRLMPTADFVVYLDRMAVITKADVIRNTRTGERYEVMNDPNEPSVRPQLAVAVKELK